MQTKLRCQQMHELYTHTHAHMHTMKRLSFHHHWFDDSDTLNCLLLHCFTITDLQNGLEVGQHMRGELEGGEVRARQVAWTKAPADSHTTQAREGYRAPCIYIKALN